ncbi:hypothetical protein [Sphingobium sp. CCH11-B1]|uniref:hypothetical protein n=1 Tax=Sphingobium sp. CCH11-B1 TaxID=1768781 RepID=UPI00082C605E|nr:hypothetical protein [Sphingobium sp. CCH11-B1]
MSYVIGHGHARACNCVGPQNGDPVCPCAMPAYRERQLGERALEFIRKQGLEKEISHETPAQKAKRIGVPLIPARPKPQQPAFDPVISVCGACGMEMRKVMGYACPRSDCPCFPQVTA